jgi:hypothetical protein
VNARLIFIFTALFTSTVPPAANSNQARADPDSKTLESTELDFEKPIEALIHRWFAVLEDPAADAATLSSMVDEAPFDLLLGGEALRDPNALLAWVFELRAAYPHIEYQIDPIQITPEGQDRFRVRFEFNRNALDPSGFPHVARREHTWIVYSHASELPLIQQIEERPLLFFPGTGPQIICY